MIHTGDLNWDNKIRDMSMGRKEKLLLQVSY